MGASPTDWLVREPTVPFPELRARFRADPRGLLNRLPGVVVVDKPGGALTSHDIVARARRALREKRIGHAGTLDPMASGVLLLLLGNATRLFDEARAWTKSYRAAFRLGGRTDTQDRTGTPLPAEIWTPATREPAGAAELADALAAFRGEILQTPPMHSAIKKDGKPLYAYARAGETVRRDARPTRVDALSVESFDGREGVLTMTVAGGFYVRALVDDLGLALGRGAVMTELRRTAVGPFVLADAAPPFFS